MPEAVRDVCSSLHLPEYHRDYSPTWLLTENLVMICMHGTRHCGPVMRRSNQEACMHVVLKEFVCAGRRKLHTQPQTTRSTGACIRVCSLSGRALALPGPSVRCGEDESGMDSRVPEF